MLNNLSSSIQTITQLILNLPSQAQWVCFTPTWSISKWIEDVGVTSFEIVSGAHTPKFDEACRRFKNRECGGLIVSYEQAIHPIKLAKIIESIHKVEVLIIDQSYRNQLDRVHYSIEMEVFESVLPQIQAQSIHCIQSITTLNQLNVTHYEIALPANLFQSKMSLNHIQVNEHEKVLWIAQDVIQANTVSATLTHFNVPHALVHKKVEESSKIAMQQQFIDDQVQHCVTTWDTSLPCDVQGISEVRFTYDRISDDMIRFFQPYTLIQAQWCQIEWFKAHDPSAFLMPLNQNMFDFLHHVEMIEGGCSMREAERSLNIDSYEFEKIIKFLKGRKIIKKQGLNYIFDQRDNIASLHQARLESQTLEMSVNKIMAPGGEIQLPHGMSFPFISKKIMPVGFYDFAIIPEALKHEEGLIAVNGLTQTLLNEWMDKHQLSCVLNASESFDDLIDLPFYRLHLNRMQSSFHGNNPYHKVLYALECIKGIPLPHLKDHQNMGVIIESYDDGWFASVLSIELKQRLPHIQLYPICLNF